MKRIISNLIVFVLLAFSAIEAQTVFTVTKTSDPDPFIYSSNPDDPEIEGTLQWAIRKANETAGPCIIVFNIPGSGQQVIYLNYELPLITKEVTIDGTTQPGYAFGSPAVKVDGQGLIYTGFQNYNCPVTIKGLQISNFQYHGIMVYDGTGSYLSENVITSIVNPDPFSATFGIRTLNGNNISIYGNILGTDVNGNSGLEIESYGIYFQNSNSCFIGNTEENKANKIVNCGVCGVLLYTSNFIKISGNSIYNNLKAIELAAGSNQDFQAPTISFYSLTNGDVAGTAVPNSTIELYGSTGNNNANVYLATTVADGTGNWNANISGNAFNYCIATATDVSNNTSVLSNAVLPQIPTTQLIPDDCNATNVSFTQVLSAEAIPGADAYLFNVENTSTGANETINSIDNYFSLNETSLVDYNTSFNIAVQAVYNGQSGEISGSCSVSTGNETIDQFVTGRIWVKEKYPYEEAINEFDTIGGEIYSSMIGFEGLASECGITKIEKTFKVIGLTHDLLKNIYTISFENELLTDSLLSFLNNNYQIEYAEKIPVLELFDIPDDYLVGNQYNLDIINASGAWGIQSPGSKKITIAVTEDAIRIDHQDLYSNIWVNQGELPSGIPDGGDGYVDVTELMAYYTLSNINDILLLPEFNDGDSDNNLYADDIFGFDVAESDNNVNPPLFDNESFSHGTHISGIAGAVTDNSAVGVASLSYNCSIIPIKCSPDELTDSDGDGEIDDAAFVTDFAILGIEYAIVVHADIINMSWGTHTNSSVLQNVIQTAYNGGAILVAGAGNRGNDPVLCTVPYYPAAYDNVVCVAASNQSDLKANFSNYSEAGDDYVTVVAPGETIFNCLPEYSDSYGLKSGTSMAAPLVSSLCALMKSHCPTCSNDEIINCIVTTCDPMGAEPLFLSGQLGAGRINAYQALLCLGDLDPVAGFSHQYDLICPGLDVNFYDESTGMPAESWFWTVSSPGTIDNPNAQNPVITFPTEGDYTVSLTVTPGTTTNFYEEVVHVTSPTIDIITESGEVCTDQNINILITLEGTPPFELGYSISDGINFPISQTITIESNTHILIVPSNDNQTIISFTSLSCEPGCIGTVNETLTFNTIDCGCIPLTNNHWQFGINWGIEFNNATPFYASEMVGKENNACISDANGNFLFSTNGEVIYDQDGQIMPGGDNLIGCKSTAQSSIILPNPGNIELFYLITLSTDEPSTGCNDEGTRLYEIDMSQMGNSTTPGEPWGIVSNEIDFFPGVELSEHLTWVQHADGFNYWIVLHSETGNDYYIFYLNENGIFPQPNNPMQGQIEIEGGGAVGACKFSPSGSLLASTFTHFGFEVLNFNNETGEISINTDYSVDEIDFESPYALEFSPNNNYLYVSGWGGPIRQYDLSSYPNNITLGSSTSSLQRRPDGNTERIYYLSGSNNLGVINNPNDYNPATVDVFISGGFDNASGLPQLVPYYSVRATVENVLNACSETDCTGEITLQVSGGFPPYSIIWSDENHQTGLVATGLCAGEYSAIVTDQQGCQVTVSGNVGVSDLNEEITNIIPACLNTSFGGIELSISGGTAPYSFIWSNGSTAQNLSGVESGSYSVTITDAGNCSITASSYVPLSSGIDYTLEVENETCVGTEDGSALITINDGIPPYTFLWSDGTVDQSIENLSEGTYSVTITSGNGCIVEEIITIEVENNIPAPVANFDLIGVCPAIPSFSFNNTSTNSTDFLWNFNDGGSSTLTNASDYIFQNHGNYCVTLTATNVCGTSSFTDEIFVYQGSCFCDVSVGGMVHYDILGDYYVDGAITVPASVNFVEGTIWVEAGGFLTINSNISFGPKGRIVVKEKGKLVVDHCSLSNIQLDLCYGNMWQGVEVWGYPNLNSFEPSGQGWVQLKTATIENAHIGVLLGKRNELIICNENHQPYEMHQSGGVIVADNSTFYKNGIDIKFNAKTEPHGNGNAINYCSFLGGTGMDYELLDENYNSTASIPYPNIFNPWAASANDLQISHAAILMEGVRGLDINACKFTHKIYGVNALNAQFDLNGFSLTSSLFEHVQFGVKSKLNTISLLYTHRIENYNFNLISGMDGVAGCAIDLEGQSKCVIFNNVFDNTSGLINLCQKGILLKGAINVRVIENTFNFYQTGIEIIACKSGLIGASNPFWIGNTFTNCERALLTKLGNKKLVLKCNDHNPISSVTDNWKNNGVFSFLGDQGVNNGLPNGPAGNQFNNPLEKNIFSSTKYKYRYHSLSPLYFKPISNIVLFPIPHNPISVIPVPIEYSTSNEESCTPVVSVPSLLPDLMYSVEPYSYLVSLKSSKDSLKNLFADININIDGGETAFLLDEIRYNNKQPQLRDLLIDHSPLSDEVLLLLMEERPLNPQFFTNVICSNLPVNNNVFNELLNYMSNSFPTAKRIQILNLLDTDYDCNTPEAINKKIEQVEKDYDILETEIINYLLDSNNNRFNDAKALLEFNSSVEAKEVLFGTYLDEENYSLANQKLNELIGIDPETDKFVELQQIVLNIKQQGGSVYDLSDTDLETVRNIAYECPEHLAIYEARQILFMNTGEIVPDCEILTDNRSLSVFQENSEINNASEESFIYLGQNYPEPFDDYTTIPYELPNEPSGKLVVKDVLGRFVYEVLITSGSNSVTLDTKNWRNGIYYYSLVFEDEYIETKKMVLTR